MAKTVTFNVLVRDGAGNISATGATGAIDEAPVIDGVFIDPPVVPIGGEARVTIMARDPENIPLSYEIMASEGTIEPTGEPNVFIWRAPHNGSVGPSFD